jgi:1-aminocyclopropane-1-carboxylate deaminase/D-cysteine desulfhydrase-like pyridoxal-dependent ACC family enzyme
VAQWPTPVEVVTVAGEELLVKRDDLCGFGRGGAKARKIEGLIGHMLARGHGELVTLVGNITNLAFDILPALRDAGIRPTLFVLDDPPAPARERARIFAGILDDIRLVGPSRTKALAEAAAAYARGRRAGRRPLLVLPGVSHPAAVVGNAKGFVELTTQLEEEGTELPDTIFVTAATGTTIGGFLLAEHALRRAGRKPIRLVGTQIYACPIRAQTLALVRWTERSLGLHGRVPLRRIEIASSQLEGGFGRYSDRLAATCELVRREAGISIDPIFGGKTWATMEAYRRLHSEPERLLYWHCGYTPEWQTLGDSLELASAR